MQCLCIELKPLLALSQPSKSELERTKKLISQFRDLVVPIPNEVEEAVTSLSRGALTASLFIVGREAHLALGDSSNKEL